MQGLIITALVATLAVLSHASSTGVSDSDLARFKKTFDAAATAGDVNSAYYAAVGLSALKSAVPQSLCGVAQKADASDIGALYRATVIADAVSGCKLSQDAKAAVDAALASDDAAKIRAAVGVAKYFKTQYNAADVLKSLSKINGGTINAATAGNVFSAAATVTQKKDELKAFVERVEDVVHQGESTETTLSFDGLQSTNTFLTGAYDLAAVTNEAPIIKQSQVEKIVNFLLVNKFVSTPEATASLVSLLSLFATNKFQTPIIVSSGGVSGRSIIVSVTNTLGNGAAEFNVVAKTIQDPSLNTEKDKKLTVSNEAKGQYTLALNNNAAGGIYTIVISAKPAKADSRFLVKDATIKVKVSVTVKVSDAELSVVEGTVTTLKEALTYPNRAAKKVEADDHQKLKMTFKLQNAAGGLVTAHQVFARLTNSNTKQEVFFIAEASSDKAYSFQVDLAASATGVFGCVSGEYELSIIIGDSAFEAAVVWNVASVNIKFRTAPPAKPQPLEFFEPRPEIQHLFRVPEPRPPIVISLAFAALTLAPVLLLLVLWGKLGANIGNFPYTPSALVFHGLIGAILWLYIQFWLNLNMFDTLTYLLVLAIPTIIAGKATLGAVAAKRLGATKQ